MNNTEQFARDTVCEPKKTYEVPKVIELGDVARLTTYKVSVRT